MGGSKIFNANTELVNCGSDTSLDNIWDGGGTLAWWGYSISYVSTTTAFAKISGLDGWNIDYNSFYGALTFTMGSSGTGNIQTSDSSPATTQWDHYSITFDADDITNEPVMYQNGVLYASSPQLSPTGTRDSDAAYDFTIGNFTGGGQDFNGLLAYVHAYNRILSVDEINEIMRRPGRITSGLVGYWTCQDPGSTVYDKSGNGNNGALTGATNSFGGPPVRLS